MTMVSGFLLYGDQFPIPRALDEFDDVVEYMQALTQFKTSHASKTGDFENTTL